MVKEIGKHIGSSFLLLAMLVLFAHAVVPHHHHSHQVCIEIPDCTLHDPDTTHPHENNHPHDKNHNCCALNQLVVIPTNQWKQECDCTAASEKHFHEWVNLTSGYNPAIILSSDMPRKPAPETAHTSLLLPASSRLRAPPIVA